MNLIFYILAGLVGILTVLQIWWDYLLKNFFKDGRTNEHKSFRKRLLVLTLVLFALNQFVGIVNAYRRDKQAKMDKKESNSQINGLTNQLALINSNQAKLSKENQQLVSVLSTNTSFDSGTRAAIIEANRKFEVVDSQVVDVNAWMSELANKRALSEIGREQARQRALAAEKPVIEKYSPCFDYSVKRLQTILAELAKQHGEGVLSSYTGIPTILQSNVVKVAEISIGTNSSWTFTVSIWKSGGISEDSPPRLRIRCNQNNVNLLIRPRIKSNQLKTTLTIPNEQPVSGNGTHDDYKKVVDEALRNLIAVQTEQATRTNR